MLDSTSAKALTFALPATASEKPSVWKLLKKGARRGACAVKRARIKTSLMLFLGGFPDCAQVVNKKLPHAPDASNRNWGKLGTGQIKNYERTVFTVGSGRSFRAQLHGGDEVLGLRCAPTQASMRSHLRRSRAGIFTAIEWRNRPVETIPNPR